MKSLGGYSLSVTQPVAPFAEAWIEMRYTRLPHRRVMSLPSRERGLKSFLAKWLHLILRRSLRGSVD